MAGAVMEAPGILSEYPLGIKLLESLRSIIELECSL